MALRYTGRATALVIDGKAYRAGDLVPLSQAEALRMAARSHLHSFEDAPEPKPARPAAKAGDQTNE